MQVIYTKRLKNALSYLSSPEGQLRFIVPVVGTFGAYLVYEGTKHNFSPYTILGVGTLIVDFLHYLHFRYPNDSHQ